MKYIGITGHRGSGKTSVAYLLGNMLERIRKNDDKDEIYEQYKVWCKTIEQNNDAIYDCPLYYVYFDEFGDMPKSFVAQLLSIDMSVLDNDTMKDNMYVNLKDFKLYAYDESFKLVSSKDILKRFVYKGDDYWDDSYISLRDFSKTVSIDIFKRFFGTDVWLKSRRMSDIKFGEVEDGWRVFSDVKTTDEYNYIKEKDGIIIRTLNGKNRKSDKGIRNIGFKDYKNLDYTVVTEGKLIDLFDTIYNISKEIYEKSR